MAKAKAKRKRKERAERLHREPIVREVAKILDTGTPTKFRWESICRHGLRAGFCLNGERWEPADQKAKQIVVMALHRIGAGLRPTWSLGQQQRDALREYRWCNHCRGRLDPGSAVPWCSELCRSVLYHRRRVDAAVAEEVARKDMRGAIFGAIAPRSLADQERRCELCGEGYKPTIKRQRFCSWECARSRLHPPRACAVCGEEFRPKGQNREQLYCGQRCGHVARNAAQQALLPVYDRVCTICSAAFRTTDARKLYCRPICKSRAGEARRKAKKAAPAPMAMAA
jgi:hypothetical protein